MFRPALAVLLVAGCCATGAGAQTGVVRGFVTDSESGEALIGVNVAIRLDTTLVTGAATREDGFFAVSGIPPGTYRLFVSFIGYTTSISTIRLGPDENRLVNVALSPADAALDEILVTSERQGGMARSRAGRISIRPADVVAVPSPAVGGDLVNYLTSLPGIVTIGDRGGQMFVRGGEPWQNLVLLDGMWVYQPFHVLGFFSSFPAEILGRVNLYAGGFGSRYGGRLASVIDVDARTGSKRDLSASASISPFVSGFLAEGPLVRDRLSFLVSVRESTIDQGASRLVDEPLPYRFGDAFLKLHGLVSDYGQMSVTVLRTHDRGTVSEAVVGRYPPGIEERPSDEVRWENLAVGARYVVLPTAYPVLAEFVVSYSTLRSELGEHRDPARTGRIGSLNTSAAVTHVGSPVEIAWGLFARTIEMESELTGQFQVNTFAHEWLTEAGFFFEPEVRIGSDATVAAGLRVQTYPSRSRSFVDPRFRADWRRGPGTWSVAGGVYHQEIVGLSDRRDAASVFTVWAAVPYDRIPRAVHAIAGYSRTLSSGFDVGIEIYHKWLDELFVPEWTAFPRFTTRLQPADGRVSGADARVEVRRPAWYLSASYGLSAVRYRALQESLMLWYGESGVEYRPGHDRRHHVNLVAGARRWGLDMNMHWQFGSGLPFSRTLGFDGFVLMDGPIDVFAEEGSRRVVYERPFNGVLPTYHRLDVTVSTTFESSWGTLTAQAGVMNAYDRRNLFYLDSFTLKRAYQLPLIPTIGLQVGLK